jgi:hypothetical protein
MYKNKLLISILILTVTLNFPVTAQYKLSTKEKKQGWELLFNGNNFDGWRGVNQKSLPEKGWLVKDNSISCTGENGGSIITIEKYGDFELEWEWRLVTPGANSGLKYFVAERPGDTGGYGYGIEYQMLDDSQYVSGGSMKPNDFHTTGAAYELYPPSPGKKVKALGNWNSSRIVSQKGKVEHWLNEEKILEYDRFSDDFAAKVAESKFKDVENFGRHKEGHILLQDHNSEVYFRNIKIRKL